MALLGESNQGLLAPRMGKAKGSYRFWEDTLSPYLQRVASGEIAEQGLKRYGDAVRAGLQGDYSNFGEVAGDAIMGPFNLAGGLLGTFGGKLAKTADLDMLKIAQEASERGMPESRVFDATGWFKGADGQWRFEIDDSGARFGNKHGNIDSIVARESLDPLATPVIADAMVHKGLFSAYPDAPNIRLTTDKSIGGSYSPRTSVDPEIIRLGSRDKSTSLHELQHAIQQREGFARGGSPDAMQLEFNNARARLNFLEKEPDYIAGTKEMDKLWDDALSDKISTNDAIKLEKEIMEKYPAFAEARNVVKTLSEIGDEYGHEAYRRLAGETEARNVQSRMGLLGDDRRMLPPWMTEDVPRDKQIVRFDGGQNMAIYPVMQGRSRKGLDDFFNPDGVAWGTNDRATAELFAAPNEVYYPGRPADGSLGPQVEKELRGEIYNLDFDLKNPMEVDIGQTLWRRDNEEKIIKEAKALGHDGLIIKYPSGKKDFVAFDKKSVKRSK